MELQGSLPPHLLPHLTFLAGHGDPNSGPHAYMEAIFPDDRGPHFLFFLEMVLVHSLGWSSICCAAQAAQPSYSYTLVVDHMCTLPCPVSSPNFKVLPALGSGQVQAPSLHSGFVQLEKSRSSAEGSLSSSWELCFSGTKWGRYWCNKEIAVILGAHWGPLTPSPLLCHLQG